jgi:hypothetical protein
MQGSASPAPSTYGVNPGSRRPTPPSRDWAVPVIVATGVVLAVVLAFVAITGSPSPTGQVTITDFGDEWSTPPSEMCNGGSSESPAVPFTIAPGAHFNLSLFVFCWPGTANGSWTTVSLVSVTSGFAVISSNLPVTVTSSEGAYTNITMSAPDHSFYGTVGLWAVIVAS